MRSIGHAYRLAPCLLTFFLLIGANVLSSAAFAQTPPPSPTSGPFHSPFNGNKDAGSAEADAYRNLMALRGKMADLEQVRKQAEACGTKADIDAAEAAWEKAYETFRKAIFQYIRDYSNNVYPPGPPFEGKDADAVSHKFVGDFSKVTIAVNSSRNYGKFSQYACPMAPAIPAPPNPAPNPPPAECTTKTQAEIDAEIAKAKDALLDTMKFLRKVEDAILKDQKDLKALQPRMGESYKTQLRDLTAKLEDDLHARDVLEREKADEIKKLGALQGQKPCPEGQTTPPPPPAPSTPPVKSGDPSNPNEREEIGAGPPPKKDQGFFGALLSHVHIDVGVGVGGHHGDHSDKPSSTKAPSDDDTPAPHD